MCGETEETQELLGDAEGKCVNGELTTSALKTIAYGYTNDGILKFYLVNLNQYK
ncbi:D-arabinono-1,4-lactone oxidase family protein [Dorcoceras hygrometricum]|uniref:D-arabinono-1,4-lactone oxidase family protein n=1 Tax=Dorcoceras hygrometricum TaxID=472368 RepID=A0A2Z7A3E5_9LAMI|nr:D-arabinono-1,4-lactone oxidase family protein [Dorcoceras hygrometricum]